MAFFKKFIHINNIQINTFRHTNRNTQRGLKDLIENIMIAEQEQDFNKSFVWTKCPDNLDEECKYVVDESNPRVVTNTGGCCTVTGSTPPPLDRATYWSVKILNSNENDGLGIYVGVAPSDVDRNYKSNYSSVGWYFNCQKSALCSGYPTIAINREYGPKGLKGTRVRTGETVGVIFDPVKSEISFVVNGVNLGVAYKYLTFYRPLVPCVLFMAKGDSVEIDRPELVVNESIPVPGGIISYEEMDMVKLSWTKVDNASFYQIEMDGGEILDVSPRDELIKRGLLPESKHKFRVRAVVKNEVSEWSNPKEAKTLSAPSFKDTEWKPIPSYVAKKNFYKIDKKIVATKPDDFENKSIHCTVKGSAPIPMNTVTSWNITLLATKNNDGSSIHVGVAPFDINQNDDYNLFKCGWYLDCGLSTLVSGPPHNYRNEEYGIRTEGGYVCRGGVVGVTMDTTKGELSFALNGWRLILAYEGIPLDKPLVPCVLLYNGDDSVEFRLAEPAKEIEQSKGVQVPSNVKAVSETCSSITVTWDLVEGASFYQVEVDGSRCLKGTVNNKYVVKRLEQATEHEFRVRAGHRSEVGEWSTPVKEFTQKKLFRNCGWKGYPLSGGYECNFAIDDSNPRIAYKTYSRYGDCSIVGEVPLPLSKASSWSVKILRSYWVNCDGIYVGVAPSDINPNQNNYNTSGWYFDCFTSTLYSGPPQKARGKEYGPKRKEKGEYVRPKDSVRVLMDMTKGELSFGLNQKLFGVAFEGIPLDKPLVPCVILKTTYDRVELSINTDDGKTEPGKDEKDCIIS